MKSQSIIIWQKARIKESFQSEINGIQLRKAMKRTLQATRNNIYHIKNNENVKYSIMYYRTIIATDKISSRY